MTTSLINHQLSAQIGFGRDGHFFSLLPIAHVKPQSVYLSTKKH